ncbi:hypothetical protein LXL04_007600 [Taraxacum kok-saghyz]
MDFSSGRSWIINHEQLQIVIRKEINEESVNKQKGIGAIATDPFPALHCLRSTPCAPRRRRLESLPVSDHRSLPSPPALHCLRSTPYAPRRRRRLESPLRPVSATRIPIVFESPSHFNRVNRQVSADFQLLLDSVASSSINHNQLQRRTAMADILASLRSLMASHTPPLDALVVPSEDYHQSEYVSARDKRRAFVSGFTGSAEAMSTSERPIRNKRVSFYAELRLLEVFYHKIYKVFHWGIKSDTVAYYMSMQEAQINAPRQMLVGSCKEMAVQMRTIIGGGNGGTNLGHLFHFAADQFSDAGALLSAQHITIIGQRTNEPIWSVGKLKRSTADEMVVCSYFIKNLNCTDSHISFRTLQIGSNAPDWFLGAYALHRFLATGLIEVFVRELFSSSREKRCIDLLRGNYKSSPIRKPAGFAFDSSAAVAQAVINSRSGAFSKQRSQSFIDRGTGGPGSGTESPEVQTRDEYHQIKMRIKVHKLNVKVVDETMKHERQPAQV